MTTPKTDPLSRYTNTGSGTSPMPVNPYKGTGQNAYWNGSRWVPFTNASQTPTVARSQQSLNTGGNWWNRAKELGSAIGGSAADAGRMFMDADAQQRVGTSFGNFISDVPLFNAAVNALPERAVVTPLSIMESLGGQKRIQKVGPKLREGDYWGAATNLGTGLGEVILAARLGKPGASIARFAEMSTPGKLLSGLSGIYSAQSIGKDIMSQEEKKAAESATAQAGSDAYAKYGSLYNDWYNSQDGVKALKYLQTPQYETTPYGSTIKQTFTDTSTGYVYSWNPTSKMYEVTSTVTSDPRKWLSATEELNFSTQLRDLERETAAIISELQSGISSERKNTTRDIEEINRSVSGGSQDLATQLAFLGLDTSPGVLDVGQESLATQGATESAARRRALAEYISGVEGRIGQARQGLVSGKADIEAAKAAAITDKIREQQQRDAELAALLYGGK